MTDHEHEMTNERADENIMGDALAVFNTYPPLKHDRGRIEITVQDGVVTAGGHVRNDTTRDKLAEGLRAVPGVTAVETDELYDDLAIRSQVAAATPFGVFAKSSYGAVVLTGLQPEDIDEETLLVKINAMPGVRTVISRLKPRG